MTYDEFINQFPKIDSKTELPDGMDHHHIFPRAVQRRVFGKVEDDTCVGLTRDEHIKAHYLYYLEHPWYDCEKYALKCLLGRKRLTEFAITEGLPVLPRDLKEAANKVLYEFTTVDCRRLQHLLVAHDLVASDIALVTPQQFHKVLVWFHKTKPEEDEASINRWALAQVLIWKRWEMNIFKYHSEEAFLEYERKSLEETGLGEMGFTTEEGFVDFICFSLWQDLFGDL